MYVQIDFLMCEFTQIWLMRFMSFKMFIYNLCCFEIY